MKNWKMELGC